MMQVAVVVSAVLLVAAAAGAIYRLGRGPSLLDRVLAADVLLVIIVSALAVDAIYRRSTDSLPLMVTITLVGFIGSVAVARFVASRR
ncbi:cation:proton antiporter [Tersicoccus phoenicis]|uniref:Cation:proton antiporter n=1 Tax=Tersicoccus phoenicis TaxID=554083 RepID=A0A1R1LJB0_9MICC|nr:monovalent cation/H+ antiporter complex subunit F [Tersicoccus phoenicis]OMH27614.1 cation:proton antiporter [Tersicoccus phoenicis]